MKISIRQHVIFWSGYIIWDYVQALYSFYNYSMYKGELHLDHFILSTLLDFESKVLLFYILFFFIVKPLYLDKINYLRNIIIVIVSILAATFMQRAINFYIIYPKFFEWDMTGRDLYNPAALVVTMFDILVPVFLLLMYELYRLSKASREREARMEKEKLKSELSFLKAQINPHFLFNVLGTVHALARHKAPDAANVVIKLSEIMRFMLFEVKNRSISLAEEKKFLEDFIELEQIRFQNKLSVDFICDIDDEDQQIAPMILLPFVENAFKHGAAESRFHSFVHIYLKVKHKNLNFIVENSVEFSSPEEYRSGIGLNNVKRQLELIYPGHELTLEERKESFFISLRLNLNGHEENILHHY